MALHFILLGYKRFNTSLEIIFISLQTSKELPNRFDLLVPDKMNINTGEDFSEDSLKLSYTNLEARVNSAVSSIDEFLVNHKYKNIYLIGFSEGGMILPKVYNDLHNKKVSRK